MTQENSRGRIGAERPAASAEGELLSRIYRRLVPLHASLASTDAVDRNFQRLLVHEIMDVLDEIEANAEFQTADDAEHERRTLHPTADEQAARERSRATLERFQRARGARAPRS